MGVIRFRLPLGELAARITRLVRRRSEPVRREICRERRGRERRIDRTRPREIVGVARKHVVPGHLRMIHIREPDDAGVATLLVLVVGRETQAEIIRWLPEDVAAEELVVLAAERVPRREALDEAVVATARHHPLRLQRWRQRQIDDGGRVAPVELTELYT